MKNYRKDAPWLNEQKPHETKNFIYQVTVEVSLPCCVECQDEGSDNEEKILKEATEQLYNQTYYDLLSLRLKGYKIGEAVVELDPVQPEKPHYEHKEEPEENFYNEEIPVDEIPDIEELEAFVQFMSENNE